MSGSSPSSIAIVVGNTFTPLVTILLAHMFQCFPISPSIITCPAIVPSVDDVRPDASRVRTKTIPTMGANLALSCCTANSNVSLEFGYSGVATSSIPALTIPAMVKKTTVSLRWIFLVLCLTSTEAFDESYLFSGSRTFFPMVSILFFESQEWTKRAWGMTVAPIIPTTSKRASVLSEPGTTEWYAIWPSSGLMTTNWYSMPKTRTLVKSKKNCSIMWNLLVIIVINKRTSSAPKIAAYRRGTPKSMLSATTVPKYSARSVAAAAASAASQYGITNSFRTSDFLTISGKEWPDAIPSFPERYCRSIAIPEASQTAQTRPNLKPAPAAKSVP